MPRILLLATTTTYRAGSFLAAAAALGVTAVVGTDRPQALATIHPAGNLTLEFARPEHATRAIVAFAARHPIDAVIAADDEGVILAAMAAEALGLTGNPVAAARAARAKDRMREMLAAAGLPTPRFATFSIAEDPSRVAGQVEYPCVIKPLDLAASRGVIRADDPIRFAIAFGRVAAMVRGEAPGHAEAAPRILVESYLPGLEVAVEGLLTRGALRMLAIFDKPDPLEGPFFEETIYVTPSRLPAVFQERIAATTARMAQALGLCHGPVHAEMRIHDGQVWPLEIAPRSIGGLCSRALRFDGGMTLEALILGHALGTDVSQVGREPAASGVLMIPVPGAGVLRGVRGQDEARRAPAVEDVRITLPVGQSVVPLPEGSRYLGFIFARADTPEAVETALREAHRRLGFDIDPLGLASLSREG